jgi:hypothetical protein
MQATYHVRYGGAVIATQFTVSGQWSRVGNTCGLWFVRLLGRSDLQQAVSKATTSFWSALHDFAQHDMPVPAKGLDEVGPDHPFLSVRIQVPLSPCLAVALPP